MSYRIFWSAILLGLCIAPFAAADDPAPSAAAPAADAPADKPADAPADKPADAPADKPADAPAAEAPEDGLTPHEKFVATLSSFNGMKDQAIGLREQIAVAPAAQRQAMIGEYYGLIQRLNDQVGKLKETSLAAYVAQPNEDRLVIRTLLGVLHNSLQSGDAEEAKEIADALVKHDCQEKAAFSLIAETAMHNGDDATALKYFQKAKEADLLSDFAKGYLAELEIRAAEAKADDLPRVKLTTTKGDIVLELFENEAPQTVGNFVNLVEKGFYDGTPFHRVLEGFMAQGGDPEGTGMGGPGYRIKDEYGRPDHRKHYTGAVAMAHSAAENSAGSQFYMTFRPTSQLDGGYTVFGRVMEGMDIVNSLQKRDPNAHPPLPEPDKIVKAEVLRKRDHVYEPTIFARDEPAPDADDKKPEGDDKKPEGDKPADDDKKPEADDDKKPEADDKKPADEEKKPEGDKPAAETEEKAADADKKPAEEEKKPAAVEEKADADKATSDE
ncbi:peptidylprolyl isomerase [Lignipirellula cremea]|uniref:peptidylprolyl isomerase n=1 Tax=Lignipirellula cremea TaxID=2528010 RepID=A0A518DMZ9_9BACT|nr:peptidylprolyl isomerase [Lignipirellula cremea]QDU93215.1 putative peptidyl-prolyl cis-trans isomerase [Lignipirellula cremea]